MLLAVLTKIVTALEEIALFQTVGVWQGDMADLINQAQKLPSAHAIFSSAEFDPANVIGSKTAPLEMLWSVIIMSQNLRDRNSGNVDSLELIQAVLDKLTGLPTGYGPLWPVRVQLIGSENGRSAYGFHFTLEKGKNNR